ncbi:MAG: glycoside hydrolase family 15 protein [Thermoplasmatota archaeon]
MAHRTCKRSPTSEASGHARATPTIASSQHSTDAPPFYPISHHGAIGGGANVALVSPAGDVVWWCTPRFDSPPAFDALLGGPGFFRVRPEDMKPKEFGYVPNTNVLRTVWASPRARVVVHDFIAWPGPRDVLIRIARCERGKTVVEASGRSATATSNVSFARKRAHLAAGESAHFIARGAGKAPSSADDALVATIQAWRSWIRRCDVTGPYADLVRRSLLALRLLIDETSGAIVAAPTTSLPEEIGGVRNWDYRFAWIRDSAFCVRAFQTAGCHEEARKIARWVLRTIARERRKHIHVLYRSDGRHAPLEQILNLPGYRTSWPVRVGNGALRQFQTDVYGHVLDALHACDGLSAEEYDHYWSHIVDLLAELTRLWRKPDQGIWEIRADGRHFVYSKVMAWAAFDRAIRLAEEWGYEAPLAVWKAERKAIRDLVLRRGLIPGGTAFAQAFDSTATDASNLRIGLVGFVPPNDPHTAATIALVQEQLREGDYLARYRTTDGLPGREGAFLACSSWLAQSLAAAGRLGEAAVEVDRLGAAAGPLGLFSEELDPRTGTPLGNYPFAIMHASFVLAIAATDPNWRRQTPTRMTQGRGTKAA